MSRSCPSCGSAVESGTAICPVCGESLIESETGTLEVVEPAIASDPVVEETPVASEPEPPVRTICPGCGAANLLDAPECSVCGEALGVAAVASTAPIQAGTTARHANPSRTYMMATIAGLLLTGLVFLISRREEVTSAPTPPAAAADSTGGGAMPHNHPPVQQGEAQPAPEQLALIATLQGRLEKNPKDDSTRMQLADLYYDSKRYTEAVPLYRELLGKKSDFDLQIKMATAIAASGDNDGAIAELGRLMAADPKNQQAALTMSVMYVNKRNIDSVTYWLQHVVTIDSTSEQGKQAAMILEQIKSMPNRGGV